MHFKGIEIENFRGIKRLAIESLNRVNIFTGKNNSGKSSILEAVFLITGISNPNLIINIDRLRNLSHDTEDDFSFPFYGLNNENQIRIKASQNSENSFRELLITRRKAKTQTVKGNIQSLTISTENTEAQKTNGINFDFSIKDFQKQKETYQQYLELKILPSGVIQIESGNSSNQYQEKLNGIFMNSDNKLTSDLATRIDKLIIEKKKDELIKVIQGIDSKIIGLELGSKNMIYVDIGSKRLLPAQLMGDGLIKTLNLATNIYNCKNGVLLIDELDNGLHYTALKQNLLYLIHSAIKLNCQIFFTSHSKELLRCLYEISIDDDIIKEAISCFLITKGAGDNCMAHKFSSGNFAFMMENEFEIRGEL